MKSQLPISETHLPILFFNQTDITNGFHINLPFFDFCHPVMNMAHFNDTQLPLPNDSFGKNPFDNRQQSRIRNPQPNISIRSNFDFKKPRFSSYARIPLSVNRSKLNIPYKSEMCMLFQKGKCYYGENCHFYHSTSEISKNPGFKTVANEEHLNEGVSRRNTDCENKVCRRFSSGAECHFEKVPSDLGFGVNGGSGRSGNHRILGSSLNSGECCHKPVWWKTRLCLKWEDFGNCNYGSKCNYAHGIAELQKHDACAKTENRYTSRSTMASKPQNAASLSEVGKKIAEKMQLKGKRCFVDWDIAKTSRIYADWIDS